MLIVNSSCQQAGAGSASTTSIKQQMLDGFVASKEYRHGFVEESIRSRITAQINSIRNERGWDYKAFADKIGKKPSWVYRLEDPNSTTPTIPTLLAVAEAFDIGLDVRFRAFSELLEEATSLTPEALRVPCFDSELREGHFRDRRKRSPGHRRGPNLIRSRNRSSRKASGPGLIGAALGSATLAS